MKRELVKGVVALSVLPVLALATQAPVVASSAATERAAEEVVVRSGTLPRGAAPRISWLSLNVVHTPNGHTHRLPWTEKGAADRYLTLQGRSPEGWVVTDYEYGSGATAWLVHGDEERELTSHSDGNDEFTWMVARDGTALLSRAFTEGSPASIGIIRVSDGTTVDHESFSGRGDAFDFSGPEALLGADEDTVLWELGGDVTPLGTEAVAGDIRHDVLIVPGAVPGTVGPTTISDPGPPTWSAPLEFVEVSPDGRFLVGRVSGGDNGQNHLEIRRLSDGLVMAAFDIRGIVRVSTQWESPRSIMFIGANSKEQTALVRCRLDQTCNRATAWRSELLPWYSLSMVRAPQVFG
jgi:hypothetical protein